MQLDSIEGNTQRLDGGSMFGNCPRAVWERWAPADELHRIDLACRCLLVRDAGRTILLETGIGAFFEPKMRARFGVQQAQHVLLESLAAKGVAPGDVDVIVLSHMHFDHAGGLLSALRRGAKNRSCPGLPQRGLRFTRRADHWERAQQPAPARPRLLRAHGSTSSHGSQAAG